MANATDQPAPTSTVVYRPRRRCPKCGLVNSDLSRRCRRCRRPFDDIDPRVESERLVERLRMHRVVAGTLLAAIFIGLCTTGYVYWQRQSRIERFDVLARRIQVDLESAARGSVDDAQLIVASFDDAEAVRVLADQASSWAERKRRCAAIRDDADDLLPQNPAQTELEVDIERRLTTLGRASSALAAAGASSDAAGGRAEASRFITEFAGSE